MSEIVDTTVVNFESFQNHNAGFGIVLYPRINYYLDHVSSLFGKRCTS